MCSPVEQVVAVLPASRELVGRVVIDVRGDVRPERGRQRVERQPLYAIHETERVRESQRESERVRESQRESERESQRETQAIHESDVAGHLLPHKIAPIPIKINRALFSLLEDTAGWLASCFQNRTEGS